MKVLYTNLEEVIIIEQAIFGDHRGYFTETYNHDTFFQNGLDYVFVQDNQSYSASSGTLRGLHYQLFPKAQTKLVRVLSGAIYDVAVDIRKSSHTFGQWTGAILSAENHRQLLIPKGYAHGFCTITPNSIVAYKVDELYSPEHDRGILWSDPDLAIKWPTSNPILSTKDEALPLLSQIDGL